MTQWAFYFDAEKCIGCHACSTSCEVRNDVDDEHVKWRRLEHVGEGTFPDYEETSVSMSCFHCAEAPCSEVCPTNAIQKRDSDGIVTVDGDKCIGCHYCSYACPFGACQYGEDGLLQKCHLCLGEGTRDGHGKPERERPEEGGRTPACVNNCVTDALKAGPINEVVREASEGAANRYKNSDVGPAVIVEPANKETTDSVETPETTG